MLKGGSGRAGSSEEDEGWREVYELSMLDNTREARCGACSVADENNFSTSLSAGMLWIIGTAGLSSAKGKGNSACFSNSAFGVGDSIALRALSESAAMRELSRTSPP